jgi:hypothetical protein
VGMLKLFKSTISADARKQPLNSLLAEKVFSSQRAILDVPSCPDLRVMGILSGPDEEQFLASSECLSTRRNAVPAGYNLDLAAISRSSCISVAL